MTKIKLSPPSTGELNTVADPLVTTAIKEVESWLNGKNIESTDNLKVAGIKEASLEVPLQEKIAAKATGLTFKEANVSVEAATGELIETTKSGITITLPAATVNRTILVFCGAGTTCKVTASAGKIFGDFVTGSTTVELLALQHIWVFASGANWYIIAGEPKKEAKYTEKSYSKAEAEAGVEPSATRPATVVLHNVEPAATATLTVGGEKLPNLPGASNETIWTNPGEKWIANQPMIAYTRLL